MTDWKNRIVSHGVKAAVDFMANPANPRRHPPSQREAMRGSLDTLGWIAPVIELKSGELLDGHERIWQALAQGDDTPVPYIIVDLTEDEAALALASFDFITTMATYDRDALDTLLKEVQTDDARLQAMLAEMAAQQGLSVDEHATDAPDAQIENAGELQKKWQVERGQRFQIGRHTLICGDSLTDKPPDLPDVYTFFCDPFFQKDVIATLATRYSFDSAVFLTGGEQLRAVLIHVKNFHEGVLLGCATQPQMGNYMRLQYEHKMIIWAGERLQFGVAYSSVIESEEGARRLTGDVYHHTAKPVDAITKILSPFSQTWIVDAFAGAGSTFLAAERLNRSCYGIEIEPPFCAVILERLSLAGLEPVRVS
jgi:hypothetical protein